MPERHGRDAPLRAMATAFGPFFAAFLVLLAVRVAEPAAAGRPVHTHRAILDALWMVESSGREQPPDGDDGKAIGPYQIHRDYWLDAVTVSPELGTDYQDCRKRAYAERVIEAYMRRHAPDAWQRGDAEVIARIHNGGPRGMQKPATEAYWQKVRRHLPE